MAASIRHVKEIKRLLRKCSFVQNSLFETKEFQTVRRIQFDYYLYDLRLH